MLQQILLTLVAILFIPSAGSALTLCDQGLVDENPWGLKIIENVPKQIQLPPMNRAMMVRTRQIFAAMANIAEGYLTIPQNLQVLMVKVNFCGGNIHIARSEHIEPARDPRTGVVAIPYFLIDLFSPELPKLTATERNAGLACGVHELGHAFFAVNVPSSPNDPKRKIEFQKMKRQLNGLERAKSTIASTLFQESSAIYYEHLQSIDGAADVLLEAKLNLHGASSGDGLDNLKSEVRRLESSLQQAEEKFYQFVVSHSNVRLSQRYLEVSRKIGALQTQIQVHEDQLQMDSLLVPYEELFTDTFAVILLQDPRAIARVSGGERDFSKIIPIANLSVAPTNHSKWIRIFVKDQFDQVLRGSLTTAGRVNFHPYFDLVRGHLWRIFSQSPEYRAKPGLFLKRVLRVLLDDADEIFAHPELQSLSQREANQRLLEKLMRAL